MGILSNVLCQVGITTIIANFLILDMPIDRDTLMLVGRGFLHTCSGIVNMIENITSTFDGICHPTFRVAKTRLDSVESDNDDEEEYEFQRNKFKALIYGPKPAMYLNCSNLLDYSLALQEVMNPFRNICVWKKVEDIDGQWHAEIRLTDPYGNTYDQRFVTKKASTKLAKYHKLSDIMSPNWFQS
nr:hypothetical protein [Tanacetum cinerariifolium]